MNIEKFREMNFYTTLPKPKKIKIGQYWQEKDSATPELNWETTRTLVIKIINCDNYFRVVGEMIYTEFTGHSGVAVAVGNQYSLSGLLTNPMWRMVRDYECNFCLCIENENYLLPPAGHFECFNCRS